MINKYIDLLLADKYQIKIADSTASFPATNVELEYGGIRSDILAAKYSGDMAIVPGVGINYQEVVDALQGNSTAKEGLKNKVIIQ